MEYRITNMYQYKKALEEKQSKEMAKLYEEGTPVREIAKQYHFSVETIQKRIFPYSPKMHYYIYHRDGKIEAMKCKEDLVVTYERINSLNLELNYITGEKKKVRFSSCKDLEENLLLLHEKTFLEMQNMIIQNQYRNIKPVQREWLKRWQIELALYKDASSLKNAPILELFDINRINELDQKKYNLYLRVTKGKITKLKNKEALEEKDSSHSLK